MIEQMDAVVYFKFGSRVIAYNKISESNSKSKITNFKIY